MDRPRPERKKGMVTDMAYAKSDLFESGVSIKVVGVGGGGNNAVNRMISSSIRGVDFIAVNTDKQALRSCNAPNQITIGEKITRGHGAGANAEIGQRAAEESTDDIKAALAGADMIFIAAGMGGGTGTGAAPVVARLAREMGILTVAIVTKPFIFEGRRRMLQAEKGIKDLSEFVDSLVVIPNERLKQVSDTRITLYNAFEIADDVLRRGVQSISELINGDGFINLDFADVTSVMQNAGYAHMGVGEGSGKDKAEIAARAAISSPLLETSIKGATGILVNITISPDVGLEDADLASSMITAEADPDANVIWGVVFDDSLDDQMKITIIATGFAHGEDAQPQEPAPAVSAKPAAQPVRTQSQGGAPAASAQMQRNAAAQQAAMQAAQQAAAQQPAVQQPQAQHPAAQQSQAPQTATGQAARPAQQNPPQAAPNYGHQAGSQDSGSSDFDSIMELIKSRKPRDDFSGRR